jgi:hypothetical protein
MRAQETNHMIPDDPDRRLTRNATATALTAAGFPIKAATLATKATRGGGPPFSRFGLRALYRWGDALAWAQGRLSQPVSSTSELADDRSRAGSSQLPAVEVSK